MLFSFPGVIIMKINETKTKDSTYSKEQIKNGHLNHMHGVSYDIKNPITQLRTIASSCFFGEPQYYHSDKVMNDKIRSGKNETSLPENQAKYLDNMLTSTVSIPSYRNYSASRIMEMAIDEALDFDPENTLQEAVRLRNEDNFRTTPQVIMVRAAHHDKVRGTSLIKTYAPQILKRTDEAAVQLAYQMQVYGNPIPNSLKKAWKAFLETKTEYDLAKYRMESHLYKTVDVVNLTHAYTPAISKLVKGQLKLSTDDTWEALISKEGSSKSTWEKAIGLMGHMALLRNLRNLNEHKVDPSLYVQKLIDSAPDGKQLPFRYFSAYQSLKDTNVSGQVLDAIEKCLELSIGQLPQFKGRVMSLCDNSGSAQGTTTSSLGTIRVADIANITAILTGKASEDGYVGVFGDRLETRPVRKNSSVFDQVEQINKIGSGIGGGTENGIWLFFDNAIKTQEHWDSIFVYSDMQAGHGGLFGLNESNYKDYLWQDSRHIDVAKLIKTYREKVNPDVNVYLVQVAGYKDTLVPEFYDKTYILGGWGDGILRFAHEMSKEPENQLEKKQAPAIVHRKSRFKNI